ncbi:hypothetical protein [Actinoplanes sp. NPDC049316]|uniref:hypothetical protein n=1 Tax=Actinoplanes sp. NPDC049316 TaxID=3154727 RepID=UPI003435D8BD
MTMRLHSFLGRSALPLALIGLATMGAALPAHADPGDDRPEVGVYVPERVVTVDSKTKTVEFVVSNESDVKAEDLVAGFGSADDPVPASLVLTPPQGCTDTSACKLGDLEPGDFRSVKFQVQPTGALPALGASFPIVVRDASSTWQAAAQVTVVRAEAGVDLEMGAVEDIKLAPGRSAKVPVVVRNAGNRTVDSVAIILAGTPFISFPATYSNCLAVEELEGTACFFDQPLGPDEVLTVSDATPLKVKVAADAPGPADYLGAVFATDPDDLELADLAAQKVAAAPKASQLKLVRMPKQRTAAAAAQGGDLNGWDNATTFRVKVSSNPADSAAVGATFAGAVGETRTVQVGVRNNGPAATMGPFQGWITSAMVEIPKGVALTKVDEDCFAMSDGAPEDMEPGKVRGRAYVCFTLDSVKKGDKALFSFTGRITGDSPAGSVTVDGGDQDPVKSNDVAPITVELTAGGSGGGLPVTGSPAGLLAGGGALLLAAGAVAFVTARRRRIVTVAE